MKGTSAAQVAVALVLAALFLILQWNSDAPVLDAIFGTSKQVPEPLPQVPPDFPDLGPLKKEYFDFEHAGFKKWVYTKPGYRSASPGSVLVASSIANEFSFGRGRTFADFYNIIETIDYPKSSMTLALYCGSAALLENAQAFFDSFTDTKKSPYNQVTLLYAPSLQTDAKTSDHDGGRQRVRRRNIARGRNFVVANGLQGEQYTLFMDADIVQLDHPDLLRRFVESGKDILVPRIMRGEITDYDKNSWRGIRKVPTPEQLALIDQGKWEEADYVPEDTPGGVYHLGAHPDKIKDSHPEDIKRGLSYAVPLDSVGGAILFVTSMIFRRGVMFPTINVVGTAWSRTEGYDGIETEGLCYSAQTLGYKCFAMPNLVAQHDDFTKPLHASSQ